MKQYFETQRLIFRSWQEEDISYLARLNSDDKVMEYFLKKLSYQETIALYNQIQEEFTIYGFGAYSVEEKETGVFIGFVGLHNVTFEVDFAPAVEILWRLLPEFWGKGYATEAAIACLNYAKEFGSYKTSYRSYCFTERSCNDYIFALFYIIIA